MRVFGTSPVDDGEWHHIAATWDGTGFEANDCPSMLRPSPEEALRAARADALFEKVELAVNAIVGIV